MLTLVGSGSLALAIAIGAAAFAFISLFLWPRMPLPDGVAPILGRTLTDADASAAAPPVVAE